MKPACPSMALVPSSFSIAIHSSSSSIRSPCRWLCHALPIVQSTKFDLIINLKTAKFLGLQARRRLSAPSPIGRPPQHGNITPRRSPPHAGKQHFDIALLPRRLMGSPCLHVARRTYGRTSPLYPPPRGTHSGALSSCSKRCRTLTRRRSRRSPTRRSGHKGCVVGRADRRYGPRERLCQPSFRSA